ncbi:MAG: hypothetical protein KDD50_14585, partial [Bdellovibrionales bacterium]|nr:hypothetical protein [Bdellovibrionales bacterium]
MSSALSDQLQVWGVEDDTIIYTDGSIGFCLALSPIDVSCADEYTANKIHDNLCKFLNALPSGIDIQFLQEITEGNKAVIDENEQLCHKAQLDLIKELNLKKVETLRELDAHG